MRSVAFRLQFVWSSCFYKEDVIKLKKSDKVVWKLYVCMCATVCPHEISRLSMDKLSSYLIFCDFSKMGREFSSYIKIRHSPKERLEN